MTGQIKKLLEKDLQGGYKSTDVYPVTSFKAVYDIHNNQLDEVLARKSIVNISLCYNEEHTLEELTLEEAIAKVYEEDRSLGFLGSFLSSTGWQVYRYIGTDLANWLDTTQWESGLGVTLSPVLGNNTDKGITQKALSEYISLNNWRSLSSEGEVTYKLKGKFSAGVQFRIESDNVVINSENSNSCISVAITDGNGDLLTSAIVVKESEKISQYFSSTNDLQEINITVSKVNMLVGDTWTADFRVSDYSSSSEGDLYMTDASGLSTTLKTETGSVTVPNGTTYALDSNNNAIIKGTDSRKYYEMKLNYLNNYVRLFSFTTDNNIQVFVNKAGTTLVSGTIEVCKNDGKLYAYASSEKLRDYFYYMEDGTTITILCKGSASTYVSAYSQKKMTVLNTAYVTDTAPATLIYSASAFYWKRITGVYYKDNYSNIIETPFYIIDKSLDFCFSDEIASAPFVLTFDSTANNTVISLKDKDDTIKAVSLSLKAGDECYITYDGASTYSVSYSFSQSDKLKLNGIAEGAEANVQSDWNATEGDALILNKPTTMVNPNAMTIGGKTYDGSAAVDVTLTDLDTYSKEEINEKLTYVIKYEKVTALPETGVVGTIYLVPKTDTGTQDLYDEYMYVDSTWEKIGSVDMSNYYTKTDIDTKLADYPSIYPKQTYTLNVEAGQGTTYPYYIRKCLYSCPTYGTSTIHIVTAYGDSSLAWQPYHVYDNIISNYYDNINHPAPYSLSGPYLCYDTSIDDFGQEFSSKVNLYYEANSDNSVCYVNIGFRVDNATEVNKLVVDIQPIFIPTNIITQYPLTYKTLVVFPEHTPGNVTSSVHSLGYTLYRMEGANSSVETKANAAQTKANSAYTLAQTKQDQLTAGDNITIVDNVISSTGGSGSGDVTTVGLTTDYLPKASAAKAIIDSAWSEGRLNNLKSIIESLTTDAITLTSDTTFVANNVTYSVNTPVTTTYDIASISASGATVEVLHGNPHKITDTALANIKVLNMRYAYIGNNPYFGTWLSAKTGLETVVLPEDSGSIYYNQFFMTSAIKNVTTFNNTFLTATSLWKMCLNCTSLLVFTIGRTPVCTTMAEAFSSCSSLTTLTLTNAGSEILDSAYQLALNCTSLNTVDMQNFIFGSSSHPCNTGLMFKGCTVLASVDLTNANMTYANTGYELFMGCAGLTSLHINNSSLPAFTTATTFMEMFSGCTSLVEVDLSSVVAANINSAYAMFLNCSALTTLTLPTGWCNTVDLGYAKSLSQTSIANLATALASGVTDKSLTFDATLYAAIPATVLTTISDKGWTVSTVTY